MMVRGQLESNWPLYGSPIIDETGTIFTSAGRMSEVGGGITCAAIDIATGKSRWQTQLGPFTVTTNMAEATNTWGTQPTANNELLLFDGIKLLFPFHQIDPATGAVKTFQNPGLMRRKTDELFPGLLGFLDENNLTTLWQNPHRVHSSCRGHIARTWCLDETNQWADTIPLFKGGVGLPPSFTPPDRDFFVKRDFFVSGLINSNRWVQKLLRAAQAKAILKAGVTIYISAVVNDPAGTQGALYCFDATTGVPRSVIALPSPPVFESLSAGQHCVFVATRSGLCCLGQP